MRERIVSQPSWVKPLVVFLVIGGIICPIGLYWWVLGRVPAVTAQEALALLNRSGEKIVLVDVRDVETFRVRHIAAAHNWPLEQVMALSDAKQLPVSLQNKPLFLISDGGLLSAAAVKQLRSLGLEQIYNIRGGLQAWVAARTAPCRTQYCQFQPEGDMKVDRSFRIMSAFEQWVAAISAFGIKPLYMLLSLGLILRLIGRQDVDLSALKWAFIFFLSGEAFCALNYLFFNESSYLLEILHSYGMVVAFGFTGYAVIEGLDGRVFKLSNPDRRCALLRLCGSCIKYQAVPCGARRLFLLVTALSGFLTFIPLLAAPHTVSYNSHILGTPYHYSHPLIYQIFELRYCPLLALTYFGIALPALWLKKNRAASTLSKLFFAAGVGALGFSLFRLMLKFAYQTNLVWATYWEEFTELLFVLAVGAVLWIFRRQLLQEHDRGEPRLF